MRYRSYAFLALAGFVLLTTTGCPVAPRYVLTTQVVGAGTLAVEPPAAEYDAGTVVTLTASPGTGWLFDHWEGALSGAVNPASLEMNAAKAVTAVFVREHYALNLAIMGQGAVTADPATGPYESGTTVTLTASAAAGWRFDHWEGALTGATNPAQLVMDAAKAVTAIFLPVEYALTVQVSGGGTVALDPPGGIYAVGSTVTLSASPTSGWHFDHWEGDLSGGATVAGLTMDAPKSVTAVFEREQYSLTVVETGGGAVTLDPPGGVYPFETVVTLSPHADTGNRFEIWGGELAGTQVPITITMTANRYVDAFFMPQTYTTFSPNSFCVVGSTLYFVASGPYSGSELWRTDGTFEGTRLVRDIQPGWGSSNVSFLVNLKDTLYFFATYGTEIGLWTSDGTEEGTVSVTGLGGSAPVLPPLRMGDTLYFSAQHLDQGELWKSDGTAAGTVVVRAWGAANGYPASPPNHLTDVDGTLYFNNTTQQSPQQMTLWKSDGTEAGTVPLTDAVNMDGIAGLNGQALFAAGDELNYSLVVTDGTPAGTQGLKKFDFGPGNLTVSGGLVYFTAELNWFNSQIWASDGASVYKVDGVSYRPWGLTDLHGTLLYIALYDDAQSRTHCGLYATTGAGGARLAVINPTLLYGYGDYAAVVDDTMFFTAENSWGGVGIWKSDGTPGGTMLVSDVADTVLGASPSPYELTPMDSKLYFSAGDAAHGHQVWVSDGTGEGTYPVSCPLP